MPTELPRVTITLAPAEWDALELYAAARGLRPSEVARGAVVAMLADPALAEAPRVAADPASLAAAAASLERSAEILARLLPSAEAVAQGQEYVRRSLTEIAEALGTVAGAVSPLEPEQDAFGLHVGR
jgi:DNA-directed RNA polymerase specialized sigma24 family protein